MNDCPPDPSTITSIRIMLVEAIAATERGDLAQAQRLAHMASRYATGALAASARNPNHPTVSRA